VADLDALMGGAAQVDVLGELLRALPGVTLWLDAGFSAADQVVMLEAALGDDARRIVPVFGSESMRSRAELQRCLASRPDALLSLDRRGAQVLDAAGAWDAPQLWPERVIMMTLERVGADAGPDLDTLRSLQARSPSTRFIGAGGIRDAADLARAQACGAHAWLVASALHDGRLPPVENPAA